MLVVVVTLGLIVPGLSYATSSMPSDAGAGDSRFWEIYGQLAALALLLYVALRQLVDRTGWLDLALVLGFGAAVWLGLGRLESHSTNSATSTC